MKDMKKKCLNCDQPELFALVTMTKAMPLADRNGTVKIQGVKVGQIDMKLAWDTIGGREDSPEQKIRGPIICGNCETQHFYVLGDKNPLRMGNVDEARELGYEELRTK